MSAAIPALTFRRTATGAYVAWPEASTTEFRASITRWSDGSGWLLDMTTFGRPLDARTFVTLNDARDYGRRVFALIEDSAR
jgi:hypothetical protein